jgi:ParB/RepB/Spo0J family partition protein
MGAQGVPHPCGKSRFLTTGKIMSTSLKESSSLKESRRQNGKPRPRPAAAKPGETGKGKQRKQKESVEPETALSTISNGGSDTDTESQSSKAPAAQEQTVQGETTAQAAWQVVWLPVAQIAPNPYQPRHSFDPQEMLELVASVRAHGVLQPVTVRTLKQNLDGNPANGNPAQSTGHPNGKGPKSNGHATGNGHAHNNGHTQSNAHTRDKTAQADTSYHLVSGERRLRACKEANRKLVPAIIRDDLSDAAVAELALIENVQRSNLNVMEEAAAYKRLMLEFRLKEERLAKKVGKSVQTIKEIIKLLALPKEVQPLIAGKHLSASHGQHLLKLAPFESICVQVAQYAAQHKVTATALELALLPNARSLKEQKLLVELGHKTRFDWKNECGNCPHKAYVASGYSSYCLRPEEWQKKQDASIEQQQQEAAQVMEQARQDGQQVVEVEKLPANAYRNLSYMTTLPAGCSGACPCRGEAADPRDPTQRIPICLQPERFAELVRAEREAQEEVRRRHYEVQWKEALQVLQQEWANGLPRKTVWLMARPLLQPSHYFPNPEVWPQLLQYVADELKLEMPVEALASLANGAETSEVLALLQSIDPNHLLLFTAGLQLALEAQNGSHYGGETADLDLVLERSSGLQAELPEDEDSGEEEADPREATAGEPHTLESEVAITTDADNRNEESSEPGDLEAEGLEQEDSHLIEESDTEDRDDGGHEWYWPEGHGDATGTDTIESTSAPLESNSLDSEYPVDTPPEGVLATTP